MDPEKCMPSFWERIPDLTPMRSKRTPTLGIVKEMAYDPDCSCFLRITLSPLDSP